MERKSVEAGIRESRSCDSLTAIAIVWFAPDEISIEMDDRMHTGKTLPAAVLDCVLSEERAEVGK